MSDDYALQSVTTWRLRELLAREKQRDEMLAAMVPEQLRDLAEAVLRYDALIEEVARQRGLTGAGSAGTGAWSVDGKLGDDLDARYFELMAKARAAVGRIS
jgi:hypothetical protein